MISLLLAMTTAVSLDCGNWSSLSSASVQGIYFQTQVCDWSRTGRKVNLRFVNRNSQRVSFDFKGLIGYANACTSRTNDWIGYLELDPGETSEEQFTIDDPTTAGGAMVCVQRVKLGSRD